MQLEIPLNELEVPCKRKENWQEREFLHFKTDRAHRVFFYYEKIGSIGIMLIPNKDNSLITLPVILEKPASWILRFLLILRIKMRKFNSSQKQLIQHFRAVLSFLLISLFALLWLELAHCVLCLQLKQS